MDRLLIVAPAAPGGGWDQTARAMQHALEREGLVRIVEVQNVAGAAGTIGLAQFVDGQRGNDDALLVTGLVMLGATIWNESPVSLGDVTPIARLTAEYEVVAVPAESPHRDMRSLLDALRASPGQVSWGGGSAGGTDHILAGLIAAAAGVNPRLVNYIAFSGGGEAVTALLGGNVTAGVSGYSEFAPHLESRRLRALAISAPSRVAGIDVPTLIEQGLDVELSNWRGVVGAPGISSEGLRGLSAVIGQMVRSATWRRSLADRGWSDSYEDREAFRRSLDVERARLERVVTRLRTAPGDVSRIGHFAFPAVVFTGAAAVLLLLIRRRAAIADARPGANTRAVTAVCGSLLAFLLLLEWVGFVIAAWLLFVAVAWAIARGLQPSRSVDERRSTHRLIPIGVGLLFALTVYFAFTRGLDLALPAGALWSWIR